MANHTLVALVQDHPGVLHRTVTLLRRRGYNIVSLAVGRSETAGISRMTIVVDVTDVSNVIKQLDRLVEIIGVADITGAPAVVRETVMLKIMVPANAVPGALQAAAEAATAAGGAILDRTEGELIVGATESPEQIERLITVMTPFGIAELMRTGRLAMLRGRTPQHLEPPTDYRAQADGAPFEEAA